MNHRIRKFFAVTGACCVTALVSAGQAAAACPYADAIPTAQNLPQIQEALVCLHNEERSKAKVALLRTHTLLDDAAEGHAEDMVDRGYFGHDTPSGVDPFERMDRAGYIGRGIVWNAGETIAWASGSYATPRSVMNAWLGQTAQRLTILAPDFRHIGVGVALGAPVERDPGAAPAATYTVDYGWRTPVRTLRACLRKAETKRRAAMRRVMRAKCHGLAARGAIRR